MNEEVEVVDVQIEESFRISKRVTNGSFYLITFLVGFAAFYGIQSIIQTVLMLFYEFKMPGFALDFANYIYNQEYNLLTNEMWAVLNVAQFLGGLILSILGIIFLRNVFKEDFRKFKKDKRNNLFLIFGGFGIMIIAMNVMDQLFEYFEIAGSSDNQSLIEFALASNTKALMYIAVVLFAPFVEELIFRKTLIGVIEDKFKWPRLLGVFISAAIFSALHAIDIFFVQYFVMALIITFSYYLSKNNIFVPIGIHFLNNSLILLYIFMNIMR